MPKNKGLLLAAAAGAGIWLLTRKPSAGGGQLALGANVNNIVVGQNAAMGQVTKQPGIDSANVQIQWTPTTNRGGAATSWLYRVYAWITPSGNFDPEAGMSFFGEESRTTGQLVTSTITIPVKAAATEGLKDVYVAIFAANSPSAVGGEDSSQSFPGLPFATWALVARTNTQGVINVQNLLTLGGSINNITVSNRRAGMGFPTRPMNYRQWGNRYG